MEEYCVVASPNKMVEDELEKALALSAAAGDVDLLKRIEDEELQAAIEASQELQNRPERSEEDELKEALALSTIVTAGDEDLRRRKEEQNLQDAIDASLAQQGHHPAEENDEELQLALELSRTSLTDAERDVALEEALAQSELEEAEHRSYWFTAFDVYQEEWALQEDLASHSSPHRGEASSHRRPQPQPPVLMPDYSRRLQQSQQPQPQQPDPRAVEQCERLEQLVTGRLQEIFSQTANIHQYAEELGQICRDNFLAIDQENNFIKADELLAAFKAARSELFDLTKVSQVQAVRLVLQSIEEKGEAYIEPETGINMMSLFVKIWNLAKNSNYQKQYQQDVINVLAHNKAAGGGCEAGITARLIQPYTAFFYAEMKTRLGKRTKISLSTLS